jgi:hypothetical protein
MNRVFFVLPLALLSLVLGVWGGWGRIGWSLPLPEAAGQHGLLMVGGFLGTLILLERTVVLQNRFALLLPFVNGLSVPLLLLDQPKIAFFCLLVGAAALTAVCGYFARKHRENHQYLLALGAAFLFAGHVVLLRTGFYPRAVPYWMAFLLFTITAERLELTKFLPVKTLYKRFLWLFLGVFGVGVTMPFHSAGNVLLAAGLLAIGLWLLRFDMVFKSIRKPGLHRYSGVLLLTGYVWLLVCGVWLLFGQRFAFHYDVLLHTFFIGFVMNMIFAHGPIILPAVLGKPLKPYHPMLYAWFVLLQLSLMIRVAGGAAVWPVARQWAGMLNGIAILGFFVSLAILLRKANLAPNLNRKTSVKKTIVQ